jgi:protein-S-isoprenylcysteine O-methyltransferase Ste14
MGKSQACALFLALVTGIPLLLYGKLDAALGLPIILMPPLNLYPGAILFAAGASLYTWTILLFARIGRGTQVPIVPTQRLVTSDPFAYSRNPMVSGVILLITGLGLLVNSFGFIAIGLIIPLAYLVFIKLVEEKELAARFGQEYLEYKKRVPFLIPIFKHSSPPPPPGFSSHI